MSIQTQPPTTKGNKVDECRPAALRAADLRRIATLHNMELNKVLHDLHDLEGTGALKKRCEGSQAFLKALSLVPDNGYVIAVTGLQGVGKSTLANALLKFSDQDAYALPTGRTRCEKVPVIVRATLPGEPHQAHYLPATFTNDAAEALVPVTLAAAKRMAQGEPTVDGIEPVLVDLPLPPVAAGTSMRLPPLVYLLILPGYEKGQPWSELAMASMLLADQAVFVVDNSSLATQTGRELLQEAMQRFGHGSLTVAFSKMDRDGQNPEEMIASLNAFGLGEFSTERGNLFLTGIGGNEQVGISELRVALFEGSCKGGRPARASRVRQLSLRLRQFAEDDLEQVIMLIRDKVEDAQTSQRPNQKIYCKLLDRITDAKNNAAKSARDAVEKEVAAVFESLPDEVAQKIYDTAKGSTAFFEKFNPWQSYDDQQQVKLDKLMKATVNQRLNGITGRVTISALRAFRDTLPSSMVEDDGDMDAKWYGLVQLPDGHRDGGKLQDQVSQEFLASMKPMTNVMIEILENAGKAGKSLDMASLQAIATEVINNTGIKSLRRGLFALGLVEAGELGFEAATVGAPTAGVSATPAATAGAAISAPLAAAVGVALVAAVIALSLRAAKSYKTESARQAKYLVASSQEAVDRKMVEGIEKILDWFQERLDQRLRTQLGLNRGDNIQFRLALQCERLSVLRGATLKALAPV